MSGVVLGLVWFGRFGMVGLAWYEVDIKNEDDLTIWRQFLNESNLKSVKNGGPPQKMKTTSKNEDNL